MENMKYIVATIKPWNILVYNEIISKYPGEWHLITDTIDLTVEKVKSIDPVYIFFPHWSHIVPKEILNLTTCVCFHETDLPYGRGGSPIQNLISRGYTETVITALKMTEKVDAGDIYLKVPLSLDGLAEEIYNRAAIKIAYMIDWMTKSHRVAIEQKGEIVSFQRRTPDLSIIPPLEDMLDLFNHIRMHDADSYPKAYINYGLYKIEFTRPALRTGDMLADARITIRKDEVNA